MPENFAPFDAFAAIFASQPKAMEGVSFAAFMELALYHPQIGYYCRERPRIGYGEGTDFFTATTSGPVFGELVAAACASLVGAERAHTFAFVEIGAEKTGGVLAGVPHSFATTRAIRLGDPIELSGECIVFSNELFDAQPFRRFVFRQGEWRELGVALRDHQLVEVELSEPVPPQLPTLAPENYVIDAPLAAVDLARCIARQPWTGPFVAFDYGKSWAEIIEACPAGTARVFHRHVQSNDLLARPGDQDLTCHVCWDWLSASLLENGFSPPLVESQESFFIRRAARYIASVSTDDANRFSRRKASLLQLLHPAHLGQKFQVLHACRS